MLLCFGHNINLEPADLQKDPYRWFFMITTKMEPANDHLKELSLEESWVLKDYKQVQTDGSRGAWMNRTTAARIFPEIYEKGVKHEKTVRLNTGNIIDWSCKITEDQAKELDILCSNNSIFMDTAPPMDRKLNARLRSARAMLKRAPKCTEDLVEMADLIRPFVDIEKVI